MASTSLSPAPSTTALDVAQLLRKVVSCYPTANPLELKGYLSELATVLVNFPRVAEAGLEAAMRASPEFPPAIPKVEQHCRLCNDSGSSWSRQWDARAREQLAERAAIEARNAQETAEHRRAVVARLWPRGLLPDVVRGSASKPDHR